MLPILLGVIGSALHLGKKGKFMQGLQIVVGFTIAALALYFFVGRAEESSKFIKALSDGYTNVVSAFTTVK